MLPACTFDADCTCLQLKSVEWSFLVKTDECGILRKDL